MSKINGTAILIYCDGELIAGQRGGTLNINQNLYDTTDKESSGYADHGNGLRDATIDFDALQSTTGLAATDLLDYIISRGQVEVIWYPSDTSSKHVRGRADLSSSSLSAPTEDAESLTGTFVFDGLANYYEFGTSGLICGVTKTSVLKVSRDQGASFDNVTVTGVTGSQTVQDGACCDGLGKYFYWIGEDTGTFYINKYVMGDASASTVHTLDNASPTKIVCSFSGQYIFCGDSGQYYRSSDYGATWTESPLAAGVNDVNISPSGEYAVFCSDDDVLYWDNYFDAVNAIDKPVGAANCQFVDIDDDGVVWMTNSDNNLYTYSASSWSTVQALGATAESLSIVDPDYAAAQGYYALLAIPTAFKVYTHGSSYDTVLASANAGCVTVPKTGELAFMSEDAGSRRIWKYDGTTATVVYTGTADADTFNEIWTP